jgi:hypothetical protein
MRFIKAKAKDPKGTISVTVSEILPMVVGKFNPKEDEWYIMILKTLRGRKKHIVIFRCDKTGVSLRTSFWPKRFDEPKAKRGEFVEYDLVEMSGPFTEDELFDAIGR